jgi:hypothetical protein
VQEMQNPATGVLLPLQVASGGRKGSLAFSSYPLSEGVGPQSGIMAAK